MPNILNVLRLIAAIEAAPPEQFDMGEWLNLPDAHICLAVKLHQVPTALSCGTSACMAGFCAIISPESIVTIDYSIVNFQATGRDFLGLSFAESEMLFMKLHATREQALAALHHLATTGEVAWPLGSISEEAQAKADREAEADYDYEGDL